MIIPIELRFESDKDSKSAFRTDKTIKSHDVNSVEFHISIDGLELTDNYTAKILSVFHSSKSQANVNCEIVEGKIIYKPDTNLISMYEHVTNYVYVYKGNQSLDVREFIYVVDLSKIDETSLEVKEVYDQSYADLIADFEQALSDYKDSLPQADSVRADIDGILNQFSEDSQHAIGYLGEVSATAEIAEASRVQAESERVQAETERKEAEILREDNYEQLIDTAIIEADVVEKVDNKVTELTPRMNELTAQLAQTDDMLKSESLKSSQIRTHAQNVSDIKTMVTFIDDDGYNGVLDILKPMFTARGVPYVIALRGDAVILQTEEKREQLRDLQNNHGWEMASHTMTHIHLNSSTDKEIEEDSTNFMNLMYDYGLDVESMVYPWGEKGNTSVISKYYRAGFGTSNGVKNDIMLDDYNIGREILGNSSTRDLQFFKDMIDSIDGKPRWLVFMTHVSDPATNVQQIEDVVDYVISKNIPIVTAREGLKHYGSLLNSRSNLPSSHADFKYTKIKSNGLIDSNRYLLNYHNSGNNSNVITGGSLPSDFDIGVTTKTFTNQTASPLPFGGVLVTTKAIANPGYTSQLLYGNVSNTDNEPKILYRTSLTNSDAWSGWLSLTGINYQYVTEDSPITDFQYGESVRFVTGWSLGNGMIKTIRATPNTNHGKQLFYPSTNTKIYIRRESSVTWTNWVEITPQTQSFTKLGINSITGNDLIGTYPNNVSVMAVNYSGATGFPDAGVVTTYRVQGNGWDYQTFSKYNSFEMYKRYVKTDGSWSDWRQVQMME